MSENLPRFVIRYIAVVVSVTALVSAYAAYNSSANLKTSLIEICEETSNPTRNVIVRDKEREILKLREDIEERNALDPSFFNIPPKTYEKLIREQNADDRRDIERAEKDIEKAQPVDCEETYG